MFFLPSFFFLSGFVFLFPYIICFLYTEFCTYVFVPVSHSFIVVSLFYLFPIGVSSVCRAMDYQVVGFVARGFVW